MSQNLISVNAIYGINSITTHTTLNPCNYKECTHSAEPLPQVLKCDWETTDKLIIADNTWL